MYNKIYKLIIFISIFFTVFSNIYAASTASSESITKVDEMDRSWFNVLSGSPSSAPLNTNYGFLIVEDSKFLSSYSRSGQRLWQTNTKAKIKDI